MENEAEENIAEIQDKITDEASETRNNLLTKIALTTAMLAAFAAVTSYLAGERGDEAMFDQIKASDQWAFYQAKSIKNSITTTKIEILQTLSNKEPSEKDLEQIKRYKKEMDEIQKDAKEKQDKSEHRLEQRKILANAITLFQISIAIGAISAVTRKKALWVASGCFGTIGIIELIRELFFT